MFKRTGLQALCLLFLCAPNLDLWACSSCGSGGADPVILNPNESTKLYLGLSHQSAFLDFDQQGHQQKSYGPQAKQTLDLAVAQRLNSRIFGSLALNAGRNVYHSKEEVQNGDLTLNSRSTLLQQNIAEPWLPQVQLLISHRLGLGRSVYEQRRDHFLDVFGSGYDETYVGADVWFGMNQLMAGGSVLFGLPQAMRTDAGEIQVGPMQKLIGTLGFLPLSQLKVIGGFILERRSRTRLEGVEQGDSDKQSHDIFLTLETQEPEGANYRLSLSQKAAYGTNKNASRAQLATLAWMLPL